MKIHVTISRKTVQSYEDNYFAAVTFEKHVDGASIEDANNLANELLASAEKSVVDAIRNRTPYPVIIGEPAPEVQEQLEGNNGSEKSDEPKLATPEPQKRPVRRSLGEGGNGSNRTRASLGQVNLWNNLRNEYAEATTGLVLEDEINLNGKFTMLSMDEASQVLAAAIAAVRKAKNGNGNGHNGKNQTPPPAARATQSPTPTQAAAQAPSPAAKPPTNGNGAIDITARQLKLLKSLVTNLQGIIGEVTAHDYVEALIKNLHDGNYIDPDQLKARNASKIIDALKIRIIEAKSESLKQATT